MTSLSFFHSRHENRTTIASPVHFSGKGIHSGLDTRVAVYPATDGGIRFSVKSRNKTVTLPADWSLVTDTRLSTTLAAGRVSISTVEHLMAALAGLGITDALIEAGQEIPIMDGSALPFALGLQSAGISSLGRRRRHIRIKRPIRIEQDGRYASLTPFQGHVLSLNVTIDFPNPAIGRQSWNGTVDSTTFLRELAPARTFGFVEEMERLHMAGLAKGASPETGVGIDAAGQVVNPGGWRFPDEAVRHKALDVIGDLALAGLPVAGQYDAQKPGHALNIALLEALFSDKSAWDIEEGETSFLAAA